MVDVQRWTAAPQRSGGFVVERDAPGGIGRVDGGGQQIQQVVQPLFALRVQSQIMLQRQRFKIAPVAQFHIIDV